ncbi:g_PROTEIN_RECEP_F2_3 domain-containing protein [Caerostris darwini]|uniref:G_PROTEIN_RECEP_F2_3 domain-containing protein n=1 Tax=Caerostris darwini TaxID=1538125 RepID=A0AAV4NAC5_9ARAC|nr:g_PROTEIN_RECEP_F2_3 domain-containing protein [Caerostris darwini]
MTRITGNLFFLLGTLHCPRTWDGWQCWPDTPAGEEAEGLCQEDVYFMSQPPPCPSKLYHTLTSVYLTHYFSFNMRIFMNFVKSLSSMVLGQQIYILFLTSFSLLP